jgi:hypothetical protein
MYKGSIVVDGYIIRGYIIQMEARVIPLPGSNLTGLIPNRPVHYRFGTKPVGRSGFGTGSDRWPNESVKPADSGPNRTDF